MNLHTVIFERTSDFDVPGQVVGARVGIFADVVGITPLATNDFPRAAIEDHVPGQLKVDATAWGNSAPVPSGSYVFRTKMLGELGSESPWGAPSPVVSLSFLIAPATIAVL